MMKTATCFVVLAFVLAGCGGADATSPAASTVTGADAGPKSPETLDVEDYCNSEKLSGATGDAASRSKTASVWMSKRVRTEWFAKLMAKTQSGSLDRLQKDAMLRTDFSNKGVSDCPTLDNRDLNMQ